MQSSLIDLWGWIREAASDWFEHRGAEQGAALAFYSILSLAPLVMIILALIQLFMDEQNASKQLLFQMEKMIGPEGSEAIGTLLKNPNRPATGRLAALVGLVTLLFGATGVFVQLQDSINRIWAVGGKQTSGWWSFVRGRFLSLAMVFGTALLLLISLLVSAVISAAGAYYTEMLPEVHGLIQFAHEFIAFVVVTLLFAMMFKFLPDTRVAWRDVWMGALITSTLFTVGKLFIGLYMGVFAVGSPYGAAGSLVALVVWVYYSAQVFLFGAELTHLQAKLRLERRRRRINTQLGREGC